MAQQLDPDGRLSKTQEAEPLPASQLDWREWLRRSFPHVAYSPMGKRHVRLWEWIEHLSPGTRPTPRVEIWPRGGAKSSTAELGCTRLAITTKRKFVLYVCATQDQADKHVQSIARLMEESGIERALSVYGTARGWRRSQLITANGFNVAAYGLDVASRGVKIDQYRPDLIIFDDIDSADDTLRLIENKIDDITLSILPTGSTDCAVLFLQNMIHSESIVARLVDGRADFLHDIEVPEPEPAVRDLKLESDEDEDGRKHWRIVGGTPTWEGQNLEVCQGQITTWGYRAFMREAQHDVALAEGVFFDVHKINFVLPQDLCPSEEEDDTPEKKQALLKRYKVGKLLKSCRAWDLAATEGSGDRTVGMKLALTDRDQLVLLHCTYGHWGADKVFTEIEATAKVDYSPFACLLRLPQDPAQAGKSQKYDWGKRLLPFKPKWKINSGSKSKRAERLQEEINKGNFYMLRGPWMWDILEEWRLFREDVDKQKDDFTDAGADATNELIGPKRYGEIRRRKGTRRIAATYA